MTRGCTSTITNQSGTKPIGPALHRRGAFPQSSSASRFTAGAAGRDIQAKELQAAASTLGRQLHILHATSRRDIDTAFANLVRLQASGLVIGSDPFFNSWMEQLAVLALRHAVPAIYEFRAFVEAGVTSAGGPARDRAE